jgi:cytochrome c-type biogenesis protein CcmH
MRRVSWIAAAATVLLLAVAAFLWRCDERGVAAELESTLSAAEAAQSRANSESYVRGLREHLERQPRDARAWVLYARTQTELDRFTEAALGYEKALALSPKVAKDPAVWCEYADAVAMMQGGKLAGRPRELIDRALALDFDHPKALEMAGSVEYEQGRYREALGYWRPLLAKLEPGSQLHRELDAAIERTARLSAATSAAAEKSLN